MHIDIGQEIAGCRGTRQASVCRTGRQAGNGGSGSDLGDGVFVLGTDIDLHGVAFSEAAHVSFWEQTIGEQRQEHEFRQG